MEYQDKARAALISGWAAGLGVLSFVGWAGALALDAEVYAHNALGSFLIHVPLMVLPAALILLIGVPRLPAAERSRRRVAGAVSLTILLSSPALLPQLNDGLIFLPVRLPVMGLGLALAFVDPLLRRERPGRRPARFPPAYVAGVLFGLSALVAVCIALTLPQSPPSTCHGLGCGALVGLAETAFCGAALLVAILAVVGASVGHIIGEVVFQPTR